MPSSQCPICYGPLEVGDVTPCSICGGWSEAVERFDPAAEFREYRLPSGQAIVLCGACQLEEFMVPGGWGSRLNLPKAALALDNLQLVRRVEQPALARDKFCPNCNLRLAFLKVLAAAGDCRRT